MINTSRPPISATVSVFLFCLIFFLCSFVETKQQQSNIKSNKYSGNPTKALTLQYSNPTFKAGSVGVSEAKVSISGGVFSCSRTSSGYGDISMNRRTGKIDHRNSDLGEYLITYTINNQSVSQKIIVSSN